MKPVYLYIHHKPYSISRFRKTDVGMKEQSKFGVKGNDTVACSFSIVCFLNNGHTTMANYRLTEGESCLFPQFSSESDWNILCTMKFKLN